jgi:hypothetical protein
MKSKKTKNAEETILGTTYFENGVFGMFSNFADFSWAN